MGCIAARLISRELTCAVVINMIMSEVFCDGKLYE